MADLYSIFDQLESVGAFDIALPFILIFTVIFAILEKISLFGDKKNINVIFSLVVAFLAIRNEAIVSILLRFLPNISMFLIIILMFLLLLGTFAGKSSAWSGIMMGVGFIISFVFIILALASDFIGDYYAIPNFLTDLFYDYQTRTTILFIAVLAIVILAVTGTGGGNKTGEWIKERVGELFGK